MKCTCEIEIKKPLKRTLELFDDTSNLSEWIRGLVMYRTIVEEPGSCDSQSRILIEERNRVIEMFEHIKVKKLPQELTTVYKSDNIYHISTCRFESQNDQQTKFIAEQEFQFTGFYKYLGEWAKRGFRKKTELQLKRFKDFAER
jgi:hypothetical protein